MLKKFSWPVRSLFILFSLAYLILAMHLPVTIFTTAGHDDALFWDHAQQIIAGNWLGSYNQMTLAKGVGFPLFLAINAVLGIPVTLFIALFYLFACVLLAKTLITLKINKYFVLIIFAIILLHPELFPIRIIRDNIYPALSLIIISGVIRLVFVPEKFDHTLRSVIPYGLTLGWFWLTREEGIWIVPGIMILIGLRAIQLKKQNLPIKPVFYRLSFLSVIAIVLVSLVALINYKQYGKFEAVDFKGSAFTDATKTLNSVDVGQELPYIPVSFAKRQAIYKLSPSFKNLQDYFEIKGKGWIKHGCKVYPLTCGDYAGGWFDWALRDAVANQGFYDSPVHAEAFYKNITEEIKQACEQGLIKCKTNHIPLMPNISINQWKEFPEKIITAFKLGMVQGTPELTGGASLEPLGQLQSVRKFLGAPLVMPAKSEVNTTLNGWLYSGNSNWLTLHCVVNGKDINRIVERIASPDIAEHFKDSNANFQRFSITLTEEENCDLLLDTPSVTQNPIDLSKTGLTTLVVNGHSESLVIDYIHKSGENGADVKYALKVKDQLTTIYKLILPCLVTLGVCIYLVDFIRMVFKGQPMTDIFIISTMLWCLFISRDVLLILVDISSFPAIKSHYMSAGFPILCLATFLSIHLIFNKKSIPASSQSQL